MKTIILASVLILFPSLSNAADVKTQNTKNTVDASCSHEQEIAHCGNDVVGKVLFDCIDAYKKANADSFKISSGCKIAIENFQNRKQSSAPAVK